MFIFLPFLRQETIFDDPHSFGFALIGQKLCYKQTSHSSVLKIVKPRAVCLVLDRVGVHNKVQYTGRLRPVVQPLIRLLTKDTPFCLLLTNGTPFTYLV